MVFVLFPLAGGRLRKGDLHHGRTIKAPPDGIIESIHVVRQEPLTDSPQGQYLLVSVMYQRCHTNSHRRPVLEGETGIMRTHRGGAPGNRRQRHSGVMRYTHHLLALHGSMKIKGMLIRTDQRQGHTIRTAVGTGETDGDIRGLVEYFECECRIHGSVGSSHIITFQQRYEKKYNSLNFMMIFGIFYIIIFNNSVSLQTNIFKS